MSATGLSLCAVVLRPSDGEVREPKLLVWMRDGYQRLVDEGGATFRLAALDPATRWVEVDNHDDLVKAREIACRY